MRLSLLLPRCTGQNTAYCAYLVNTTSTATRWHPSLAPSLPHRSRTRPSPLCVHPIILLHLRSRIVVGKWANGQNSKTTRSLFSYIFSRCTPPPLLPPRHGRYRTEYGRYALCEMVAKCQPPAHLHCLYFSRCSHWL
ncbi:hypothetical protein BGX38DRAFT_1196499 [Terfezia claveryi]|nr:hypothetical protein BGX38DRAFT_1196499 [Terfezia claveryi]